MMEQLYKFQFPPPLPENALRVATEGRGLLPEGGREDKFAAPLSSPEVPKHQQQYQYQYQQHHRRDFPKQDFNPVFYQLRTPHSLR
jgi:hypothetical protein